MKTFWSRTAELWCKLMHQDAMWPIHGYYRCRSCLRQYPVSWEHSASTPAWEAGQFRLRVDATPTIREQIARLAGSR